LTFWRALFVELIYPLRANATQHASTLRAYRELPFPGLLAHPNSHKAISQPIRSFLSNSSTPVAPMPPSTPAPSARTKSPLSSPF